MSKSVSFDMVMNALEEDRDQSGDENDENEDGEENEELTIIEEYKLWRKNCRYMYDFISETALTWPSLSIQWFPKDTFENKLKDSKYYKIRNLLLTTHTSGEDINYLKIASTQLPNSIFPDGKALTEEELETVNSRLKITKKYEQESEINRARHMPQDPNTIATINGSGETFIYSLDNHFQEAKKAKILKHHTENGFGLSWNPVFKGKLLTSSDDKTVALWDINTEEDEISPVRIFKDHSDIVNDVKWHNFDGNTFGSISEDKKFIYQDIREDKSSINVILNEKTVMNSLTFSPHSKYLFAVGGEDSNVALYDLRQISRPLHVMMGHTKPITNLEWDPHHDNIIASGSLDRRIILWDICKIGEEQLQDEMEDGVPELLMMHGGHTGGINDFQFNPEIPWCLTSCSDDNIVHMWKVSKNVLDNGLEKVDLDILE
ncbi:hypothetical protein BVG19_g2542 [[Candida] boidinii]|nr:hypothetical protein BVG19_g2542 [[Candida] boidinii]OWB50493.1 hypothetical protein B5S27_g2043 [[Candida] boidinii]